MYVLKQHVCLLNCKGVRICYYVFNFKMHSKRLLHRCLRGVWEVSVSDTNTACYYKCSCFLGEHKHSWTDEILCNPPKKLRFKVPIWKISDILEQLTNVNSAKWITFLWPITVIRKEGSVLTLKDDIMQSQASSAITPREAFLPAFHVSTVSVLTLQKWKSDKAVFYLRRLLVNDINQVLKNTFRQRFELFTIRLILKE